MFLALMWDVREGRGARMEKMVSLMSKINHYSALTNGKHKRGFLYAKCLGRRNICLHGWPWMTMPSFNSGGGLSTLEKFRVCRHA